MAAPQRPKEPARASARTKKGNGYLKPVDFQVLLALSREERHGYGLVQDLEHQSGGRIRLVPGSLYSVLSRLLDWGWLNESDRDDPSGPSGGPPRRSYGLTPSGRRVLEAEIERLRGLVDLADGLLAARGAGRAEERR